MRLNRLNQLVEKSKIVDGVWKLTPRHELQYWRRADVEQVVLIGELLEAGPRRLAFRFSERTAQGDTLERKARLWGHWQADSKNRLSFLIEAEQGQEQSLTFQGAWEVGPGQEILYRWGKNSVLRFQGYWDIGEDRRLTYLLDRSSNSAFRFRGTFQSASVLAKQGAIRYQLGGQIEQGPRSRTITLFGKWKPSPRFGLGFEIPYQDRPARRIDFGATLSIDPVGKIGRAHV